MLNALKAHTSSGRMLRVLRKPPLERSTCGYLIAASDELLLMHAFHDFMPDGYTILLTRDVEDFESGAHEQHWDRMLEGENLLEGLRLHVDINLTSIARAIDSIQGCFGRLIIECEMEDNEEHQFFLGSAVDVGESDVIMDHFDDTGAWLDKPQSILLDDITRVQFETPYIIHFWPYVDGPPPHGHQSK